MGYKVVKSAAEFSSASLQYNNGAKPYFSDASSAGGFKDTGASTGSSIGYIKFKDRGFKDASPMFRIENNKGTYDYNMCKLGWACDYSKPMIPLYSSISAAGSTQVIQFGSTSGDNGAITCVGFGDAIFGNTAEKDKFWSDAVFVTHNKSNTEKYFNDGHNKKITNKNMCPCVIIADCDRGGDKYGFNSNKNKSTDNHRMGNFGFQDKLYIYAVCDTGSGVYCYGAVPWYSWWQDDGVWEIFQGLKSNYSTKTYSYAGWFKLDSIIGESSFEVSVREPTEDDPGKAGADIGTGAAASIGQTANGIDAQQTEAYYNKLYSTSFDASKLSPYMTIHSIIGLPFSFLSSTDLRYGGVGKSDNNKAGYGKEYTENILYDMPIAVIKPGKPTRDDSFLSSAVSGAKAALKHFSSGGSATSLLNSAIANWAVGDYERFYTFGSQYVEYIEYVNTLCHMFAMFLGISDLDCPTATGATGGAKTYGQYDDSMTTVDTSNEAFTAQFGASPAIFVYYQPDSNITNTFDTETTESSTTSTIRDYSDKAKQFSFFGSALGLNLEDGSLLNGVIENVTDVVSGLINTLTGGNSILGESFGGIVNGNNISLPDIWSDSTTTVTHNIKIKLVSPYGDPECLFLYILRPLARLLALALPRQTSANSYREPFIVQGFSKGQFNCQLGYVSSLSVSRGGEGGESQTVHHIPTELDVDITINDMYEKVMLSNEYSDSGKLLASFNLSSWKKAFGLLVNNIGLMDFVASYSGFNLNTPAVDTQLSFLVNMLKNRVSNSIVVVDAAGKIRFPSWDRSLVDAYNDVVNKAQTFVSG